MKIAILGASGFLGEKLLGRALARKFQVRVLARSPEKLKVQSESLTIINGDYFDAGRVQETVSGCFAVLSTIGPQSRSHQDRSTAEYEEALGSTLKAMENTGATRFINVLGAATRAKDDKFQLQRALMRTVMRIAAPHILKTKQAELKLLQSATINWTAIRPGMLTEADGQFCTHTSQLPHYQVDAEQLADFILDIVDTTDWCRKTPFVSTK